MDRLGNIVVFVRAAEALSFARAAKALGMTASGVGKSIARLEAELGVRLLARSTRRVSLTDDGAVFFEHCRRIIDDLELAHGQMSNRRGTVAGRLRASLPTTLGKLFVVPRLPQLFKRHPQLLLELSLNDRWVNLVEDAVDVALRIGALSDSSLVARRVGHQQILTIASPAYLARRVVRDIGELSQHACVLFRLPTSGRERPWRFLRDGERVELRPRPRLLLDEGEAIVEAVRAGLGVSQVPSYMAAQALAAGDVVEILPELRPPPDPIHAVYAERRSVRPGVRAFIDFLGALPELQPT